MSSAYVASNNGYSTLAAAVTTSTQTTITLGAGHGVRFPSPSGGDYTLITLENSSGTQEIVSIVGRSTDVLTVGIAGSAAANAAGRGMESTTATTWSIGDVVEGRATAAIIVRGGNAKTTLELAAAGGAALIGNTPAGNIAATTVQAALNELDAEKALLNNVAPDTHAATTKTTPADNDELPLSDSAAAWALKKFTWANLKATVAAAGASFPSGTRLAFNQTAAPTGWTKDTTAALNDTAMRIVTGTVGSGGSVAFGTAAYTPTLSIGSLAVASYTLQIADIPSHTHTYNDQDHSGPSGGGSSGANWAFGATTGATGGGGGHSHGLTGTQTSSTITLGLKYNDFVICSKD